jgi:hypothetical protein
MRIVELTGIIHLEPHVLVFYIPSKHAFRYLVGAFTYTREEKNDSEHFGYDDLLLRDSVAVALMKTCEVAPLASWCFLCSTLITDDCMTI